MFVRWVITAWAILLGIVPCAGFGHQHAAGTRTAADHDARPHLHLAGHHHHGVCEHSHEDETDCPTLQVEHQHDGDAVYLPGGGVQGVRVRASETPSETGRSLTACLLGDTGLCAAVVSPLVVASGGEPADVRHGCPIYLQLRALRI